MLQCLTSLGLIPRGLVLLEPDLLLDLGLLVELVEVVDDDGDGQGDAEHPTQSTACHGTCHCITDPIVNSSSSWVQ